MSGRSAYVRKKITETERERNARGPSSSGTNNRSSSSRARAKSIASSDPCDDVTISEFPLPSNATGVGTINARFLKFSEPAREREDSPGHVLANFRDEPLSSQLVASNAGPNRGTGSQSGSSNDGRREGIPAHFNGPLEDWAYARARKPTIKTEDVSGIEKSGLRNVLDRKSDEVRKGLAKTFSFGRKKDRKDKVPDMRPSSAATVRPPHHSNDIGLLNPDVEPEFDPFGSGAGDQSPSAAYPGHGSSRDSPYTEPWDHTGALLSPPPSAKLPPLPSTSTPSIKRWIGAGRAVQRWNKLRKDPELWDPNGDVLVFFGHRGQIPRPNPSFRLSSHIIEATESRYLITLLREGSTEEDIHMGASPMGAPPMLRQGARQHQQHQNQHFGRTGQPTPPISEDASLAEADGQISYEMYFPTPGNLTRPDALRHHLTTRNVFALLYHASLVGLSLTQALGDLHARLEVYMPPGVDNVGTIVNYLTARGIDDVRGDPESAVGLLAWAEGPVVRWEEGWREGFMHACGMYGRLESCTDFKSVSPITRALLERSSLETQLRVQAAEDRLADFAFPGLWPPALTPTASPARGAADRLQLFLCEHYRRVHGRWPPPANPATLPPGAARGDLDAGSWLTRTVAQALQRDFGALYEYLVNREVAWDASEARPGRKWIMVARSNRAFEADTPELPLTDLLIEFDNRMRYPHIPHPYPLVPESIPPVNVPPVQAGRYKKGDKAQQQQQQQQQQRTNGALERRVQLAYTEATNIDVLSADFVQSDLIDAFVRFEKADRAAELDPAVARRGRWVLLYVILQTLAGVSVDAPGVRYRDDVAYHLSPRFKSGRTPPWKAAPATGERSPAAGPDGAVHELSHCWLAPRGWASTGSDGSGDADGSASGETSPAPPQQPGFRRRRGPQPPPMPLPAGGASASLFTANNNNTAAAVAAAGAGRSMSTTTGTTGYHTPATRSVRSSSVATTPPPLGSESDVSSGRSGARSRDRERERARERERERERDRGRDRGRDKQWGRDENARGAGSMSLRSGGTFGSPPEREEMEWPRRGASLHRPSSSSARESTAAAGYHQQQQQQLAVPASVGGGFLILDGMVDSLSRPGSFATATSRMGGDERSVSGRGGTTGRGGSSGRDGGAGSGGKVIRDFDALDGAGGRGL